MNHHPVHHKTILTISIAVCGAVAAGVTGLILLPHHTPEKLHRQGSMLLAPMIGVIDSCVLAQDVAVAHNMTELKTRCTGPNGSAAALVESTLSELKQRGSAPGTYLLGYTLQVPLLQLFRQGPEGWSIDQGTVGRLVRTVRDTERPLILYLFSTHFATDAPLEKELAMNPANLAQTRDGTLAQGRYYDSAINNWTFASTQTELTARRIQATKSLLEEMCKLPAHDIVKIKGVTLLGELHHMFPDFETGMGFNVPYRVTDYSLHSVAEFQHFLQKEFQRIDQLNRILGANYASFNEVKPPSHDIRTEPLQRFTEHIDSFAHGSLPISGWAYIKQPEGAAPAQVHVYRNGVFVGKTSVNQGRQDVLAAKPAFGDANTGWRLDMDFRRLPTGLHRIDVFLEQKPGRLMLLGTRHIALMDRQQSTPRALPQKALPASALLDGSVQAHIDMPADQSAYYYNPLVPLWHSFRQQQVVNYLKFFDDVVNQSCLADTPHYTHQIIPFTNPSWDNNKFAIQKSLKHIDHIRLGVSLYGNATYDGSFTKWHQKTGNRPYGITEFHPLRAGKMVDLKATLREHEKNGAEFLSFFLEPRWKGALATRKNNIFSFDIENKKFKSDQLYMQMQIMFSNTKNNAAVNLQK